MMPPQPLQAQTLADQPPRLLNEEEAEELEFEFDERDRSEDDGSNVRGLRRYLPHWRVGDKHERNHKSVREAFRDTTKEARQATVMVLCDNERVALGTIVTSSGLVLTKASELRGNIECRLADGRRVKAELVTVRDEMDLAVLQLEANGLTPVAWRDPAPPREGSWLVTTALDEIPAAIGVVSVAPREVPTPRAVLGVFLENDEKGARISNVMEDSAAADAGLRVGDVVTEMNGAAMADRDAFIEAVKQKRPGDRVSLKVLRGNKSLMVEAVLQEIDSLAQGKRVNFQNSLGGRLSDRRWGFPSVIQHDTVLRPSDCGGPVVGLDGRVVGINIARAGRVASYALPVEVLMPLINELNSNRETTPLAGQSSERRLEELRAAVQQWSETFADLQQQIQLARGRSSSSDSSADNDLPAKVSDQSAAANDVSDKVAKLEMAAAEAKSQLDKAVAALRKIEGARQ